MGSLSRRFSRTGSIAALMGALSGLTQISGAAPGDRDLAGPHLVSQEHAEGLIARFRATAAPGAVRSHYFDRSIFDLLLSQPGASGIRIHLGAQTDGLEALVLHAADQNGKDMTDMVGDASLPSPPFFTDPRDENAPAAKAPPRLSHVVSRAHADSLIARFRASVTPATVRAHLFDRSAFDALLAQPGATGLRIYHGTYADGARTLVLYATDKSGRNLDSMRANASLPCPDICSPI